MKDLLALLGLQILFPAIAIGGAVGLFIKWADKYAPAAKAIGRDWLTAASRRSINYGDALLELSVLLYGSTFSIRRIFYVVLSISVGLVSALVFLHPPAAGQMPTYISWFVYGAADFLRFTVYRDPMAAAIIVAESVIVGWIAVLLTDRSVKWLKRWLGLATLPTAHCFALLGALSLSNNFGLFAGFLYESKQRYYGAQYLAEVGAQGASASTGSIAAYVACIPTIPILVLMYLTTVLAFALGTGLLLESFVKRSLKYIMPHVDQQAILEKPLEFLAPFASASAFVLTAALLLLVRVMPY